ncbi:TetR family transcriptional regulator [Rhodococcus sp. G-MC3]|uniref:TetR/AcrR family transcriptional regulator n=1 Tax=Rhodococcus sp. G-MC3 TaxID=3046209 RepID=UPI0024BAB6E8|nr:TetR family transcriptional regulator [Rhodococcus sp. G-MC3]MDJ0393783.1 TetR family transcriptional regulator [Rhodococcus sp. G-MC3]
MDRRSVIADAATTLIADSGLRALTHRAIDVALDFPAGSTSYYFRTKDALLAAVTERITEMSRADFAVLFAEAGQDPVATTVRYLELLLDERSHQIRARHALLVDPSIDPADREKLVGCLFSIERATQLFDDRATAEGYVALCEGLVIAGLGRKTKELRVPLVTYLMGAGIEVNGVRGRRSVMLDET